MIAECNATDRYKMYDFKRDNLLNVLNVPNFRWRLNSGEIVRTNLKRLCGFAVSHTVT